MSDLEKMSSESSSNLASELWGAPGKSHGPPPGMGKLTRDLTSWGTSVTSSQPWSGGQQHNNPSNSAFNEHVTPEEYATDWVFLKNLTPQVCSLTYRKATFKTSFR